MLFLLIALQVSTTNCHPDYLGGMRCTTNTPVQMPPLSQTPIQTDNDSGTVLGTAVGELLTGTGDRHVKSRIGKMLAKGDCAGAEKYALQKGRFDLLGVVREYCAAR